MAQRRGGRRGRFALLGVAAALLLSFPGALSASDPTVMVIDRPFDEAWKALEDAVKANKMGVVTRASASRGAASRGITIPGNAVIGVYRNDYAVRMLEASIEAGIEAPLRFYLTANADGTTGLRYRTPSAVFSPYGSAKLDAMAAELDDIFARIARDAGAR